MTGAALWVIAGLVLCGAEMAAPGVFLLWIGLAALGAGASTAAFGLGWQAQLAAFVMMALALIAAVAIRTRTRPQRDVVNAPSAGLIGETCTALAFRAGEGRVSLRDGAWQARLAAPASQEPGPEPGALLRVVGLQGTTLLVERRTDAVNRP